MKFHILSDLHLDHVENRDPLAPVRINARTKKPGPWRIPRVVADVVLVAGDWSIGKGKHVGNAIRDIDKPVVTIMGNHDWHGLRYPEGVVAWARKLQGKGRGVHLLNPGSWDFGPVRIIGCTWWPGQGWSEMGHKRLAAETLLGEDRRSKHDFVGIPGADLLGGFGVADMLAAHERETAFLLREITRAKADGQTIIVMTHFGVSRKAIGGRFQGSRLNPYFFNDREDLTKGVSLWVHGHSHDSADLIISETGCRVVCNPHGYGDENRDFRPDLVIEV